MNLKKSTYLIICFCFTLLLIYFLNQDSPASNNEKIDSEYIAQISSSVGSIQFKKNYDAPFSTTPNYPENLFNNSSVTTLNGAKTQIGFENGWIIDLLDNSQAKFQVWNIDDQKKYLLHIIYGNYELISKGDEQGLIILHKNTFYSPGAKFINKKSIAMSIYANKISTPDSINQIEVKPEETPAKQKGLSQHEISTRYIETSIFKKRHLFEKCLANRIRENNIISGRLLVGFNVTELGVLKDINIIENKTQDTKIEACISDVFTQIKIRNYNGPKTFFAFPVDFK